jgi:hypothetical protein
MLIPTLRRGRRFLARRMISAVAKPVTLSIAIIAAPTRIIRQLLAACPMRQRGGRALCAADGEPSRSEPAAGRVGAALSGKVTAVRSACRPGNAASGRCSGARAECRKMMPPRPAGSPCPPVENSIFSRRPRKRRKSGSQLTPCWREPDSNHPAVRDGRFEASDRPTSCLGPGPIARLLPTFAPGEIGECRDLMGAGALHNSVRKGGAPAI